MNNLQPTIQDVAKAANVSIGTVDRVLHNRGRVSKEKEQAVLAAVEALDYKPSQIARALAVRKSNIKIGITYPNVESEFWGEINGGIDRARNELRPFGVELIVRYTKTYDINDQLRSVRELQSLGINGLVLTPVADSSADIIDGAIGKDIPFVTVIDDVLESRRVFHIGPDDFALGMLAAKLVSLYNKAQGNVIILSPNFAFSSTQQRISGFMSKVKQDKLNVNILRIAPVPGDKEQEYYTNIRSVVLDCIAKNSSLNTIYVSNGLTEWAAAAVEEAGRAEDIKVIGHEFTSGVKRFLESGLVGATIYQNPAQQWFTAIRRMYDYIIGDTAANNNGYITSCSIIMKETLPLSTFGSLESN